MNLPKFWTCIMVYCIGILSLMSSNIQEGYVGVVYIFGSLQQKTLHSGLYFTLPYVMLVHQVQVTIQTDYILNVPCNTNSGVNIMFDKIEVVNQLMEPFVFETVKNYTVEYDKHLIYDAIIYEIAQHCSKTSFQEIFIWEFGRIDEYLGAMLQRSLDRYAPGLKIMSVRLPKPIIPHEMQENYKKIVQYQIEILEALAKQKKELFHIQNENEKFLSRLNFENELAHIKLKSDRERKIYEFETNKLFESSDWKQYITSN
jgi:regulator of protease activity HflC (stomatin/prohibitin superfamily)